MQIHHRPINQRAQQQIIHRPTIQDQMDHIQVQTIVQMKMKKETNKTTIIPMKMQVVGIQIQMIQMQMKMQQMKSQNPRVVKMMRMINR